MLEIGTPAPDFTLPDQDGSDVTLSSFKGKKVVLYYKEPGDAADEQYPLILVTGRRLEHYNSGSMTRRTGNLELFSEDFLEMHPDDAEELVLSNGQMVEVGSRTKQSVQMPLNVTDRIRPGHVFTAFHFPEVRTNLLVGSSADINTSCPEYKVVAVHVRPVGKAPAGATRGAHAMPEPVLHKPDRT